MLFYDSGFQPILYQLLCIPLCSFSVYFVVFRKEIGKGVGIEICYFHMLPKAGCRRVQADDIAEIYVSCTVVHDDVFVTNQPNKPPNQNNNKTKPPTITKMQNKQKNCQILVMYMEIPILRKRLKEQNILQLGIWMALKSKKKKRK